VGTQAWWDRGRAFWTFQRSSPCSRSGLTARRGRYPGKSLPGRAVARGRPRGQVYVEVEARRFGTLCSRTPLVTVTSRSSRRVRRSRPTTWKSTVSNAGGTGRGRLWRFTTGARVRPPHRPRSHIPARRFLEHGGESVLAWHHSPGAPLYGVEVSLAVNIRVAGQRHLGTRSYLRASGSASAGTIFLRAGPDTVPGKQRLVPTRSLTTIPNGWGGR